MAVGDVGPEETLERSSLTEGIWEMSNPDVYPRVFILHSKTSWEPYGLQNMGLERERQREGIFSDTESVSFVLRLS